MRTIQLYIRLIALLLFLCPILTVYADDGNFPASAVDEYIRHYFETTAFPGISVSFATADGMVWAKGYGVEQINKPKPMSVESCVGIGSVTKSFTALAVMRLWERGEIDLDVAVTRYIPWFRTADKENSDTITVRMLLQNASGIRSGAGDIRSEYNDHEDGMEQLVRRLAGARTSREPGISFEYANENWTILGVIIEKISTMKYADFLEKEVFLPLGMNRTTTDIDKLDAYSALPGHFTGVDEGIPAERIIWTDGMGAGSELHSTAQDMAKYMALYLSEGKLPNGDQFLKPETMRMMSSGYFTITGLSDDLGGNGNDDHYGFGWIISEIDGRTLVHHGGNIITASSWVMMDLDAGIGVSILINANASENGFVHETRTALANNLLHIALGEPVSDYGHPRIPNPDYADPPLPMTADFLQMLTGQYISLDGTEAEVRDDNGRVIVRIKELPIIMELEVFPVKGSRFLAVNSERTMPGYYTTNNQGNVNVIN